MKKNHFFGTFFEIFRTAKMILEWLLKRKGDKLWYWLSHDIWVILTDESEARFLKGPWSQAKWKWFRSDMDLNNGANQKSSKTKKPFRFKSILTNQRPSFGWTISQSDNFRSVCTEAKNSVRKKRDNDYANLGPRSHGHTHRVYN